MNQSGLLELVNQHLKMTLKMCKIVRDVVAADFGQEVTDKVRVQYGGSVKPENIAEYMACPDGRSSCRWSKLTTRFILSFIEAVK